MRRFRPRATLFGGGELHSQVHALTAIPRLDSGLLNNAANGASLETCGVGDGFFGFAGNISGNNKFRGHAGDEKRGFNFGANLKSEVTENPASDMVTDTKLARQFLNRFAGFVTTAKVVGVKFYSYNGPVYDFQSLQYHLYTCKGVFVKNCRCAVLPVYELEEGQEVETEPPPNVFDDPTLAKDPWESLADEKAAKEGADAMADVVGVGKSFDASRHPRKAKGENGGGEFVSVGDFIRDKYGTVELRNWHNAAWIHPDGDLIGDGSDHQETAAAAVAAAGGKSDDEYEAVHEASRRGLVRISGADENVNVSIESRPTEAQLRTIGKMIHESGAYFNYDLLDHGNNPTHTGNSMADLREDVERKWGTAPAISSASKVGKSHLSGEAFSAEEILAKYSPGQPRDDRGEFTTTMGEKVKPLRAVAFQHNGVTYAGVPGENHGMLEARLQDTHADAGINWPAVEEDYWKSQGFVDQEGEYLSREDAEKKLRMDAESGEMRRFGALLEKSGDGGHLCRNSTNITTSRPAGFLPSEPAENRRHR